MDVFNNPVVAILGILSSIVGLVTVLLSNGPRKTRLLHAGYCVAIVLLSVPLTSYANQLSRARRAERAANRLADRMQADFTDAGFVQASLAFLEANRDLYPDTYARAQRMCAGHGCYQGNSGSLTRGLDMVELSFAMKGMLRGIAIVESVPK